MGNLSPPKGAFVSLQSGMRKESLTCVALPDPFCRENSRSNKVSGFNAGERSNEKRVEEGKK
jgi:hypothetical protein